ncbi:MAG: tetratricopeptide repeat protein, partial [Candidatus Cloacimonetes bacterium]|nr:tetratricopeptide repeat protein [Candidatus Cloacimonadota bacterium]
KNLWQRRVLQILCIYFGASWAIIEFVSSLLVDRYLLSPHLIDFSIVILLSLIPSVLLIAYFHGKPGKDEWTKFEKIGIPVNIILSLILLFFIFNEKDLGATTKIVTIENEEGEKIERVIPKSEFRKKIVIFFFENESADSTLNWLQYGIEFALILDLSQDIFLQVSSIYTGSFDISSPVYEKMKRAGFPKGIGLPFTLKKKIAGESHMNHFLSGSFTKQNDTLFVKTKLYDTKRGKLIAENSFKGTDIFQLVDEITIKLKHDLEVPARHIEEAKDLPIAEMLTNSIPAYKMYITGLSAMLFDNDYENAINNLEQSVSEEPTFALAYCYQYSMYISLNQRTKAENSMQNVMQYIYKLPEKYQFLLKCEYYFLNQDPDNGFLVVKMWVELYPDDISAHVFLGILYMMRNQMDEAISEYKCILELDPEQYDYLKEIGSLYEQKGEFEEALKYYTQYAKQCPKDYSSYTTIGDLSYTMGDYQQAKSYYEKALVLEPDEISTLVSLADIENKLGNFEKALEQYESILKLSRTPQDSAEVYSSLEPFYETKGQIGKSIKYAELGLAESEKFQPPFVVLLGRIFIFDKYIQIGKKDEAFQTIQALETQLTSPFDKFVSFGYLGIYLELEDADNAEKAIEGVKELIKTLGFEMLRLVVFDGQARIHEIRGDYEQAILMYQKVFELQPTDASINMQIGRCYRKMGKFKKAEKYLQKTLKILQFNPETHYEIALLYEDMGKKEKALEHLKITLNIWKDADPEYIPAQKAREKLKEWRATVKGKRIESANHLAFYAGDIIPMDAHKHLSVTSAYDINRKETFNTKKKILEELNKNNGTLFLSHDTEKVAIKY